MPVTFVKQVQQNSVEVEHYGFTETSNDTNVIEAAQAGKKIRIHKLAIFCNGEFNLNIKAENGIIFRAYMGDGAAYDADFSNFVWEFSIATHAFEYDTTVVVAGGVTVNVWYEVLDE